MESTITILVYLAGTLFVVMFASRFFNSECYEPRESVVKDALSRDPRLEPALPRYVTEKTRYNLYLGTFIFVTVMLYYFVSLIFPTLLISLLGAQVEGFTSDKLNVGFSVALVVGTLAFINLSPKIPFIGETLTDWKIHLHKKARIPDKGMQIFNSLRFSTLNTTSPHFMKISDEILSTNGAHTERRDIDSSYFSFDKERVESKWAKLVYLMHAIEQWHKEKQFKRHLESDSLKWLHLENYYRTTLIPSMEDYRNGDLDEEAVQAVITDIEVFSIKIYWLITLLLFMANNASEDPSVHLKQLGWIITPDKYFTFSFNQIIFTGMVVFFSILLGSAVGSAILLMIAEVGPSSFNITPEMILNWLQYGIPMYIVPLAVTMLFKRYLSIIDSWRVQRPEDQKIAFMRRPWGKYFTVGLSSYIATFAILSGIYYVRGALGVEQPSDAIAQLAVYCGLAFITSIFICYLIDSPLPGWELSPKYYLKSLPPALLQGSFNVAMLSFAFLLFCNENTFDLTQLPDKELGKLIIFSVIGFTVGVAIHITSRIGTRFYERREFIIDRSAKGWWTIQLGSVSKRVETTSIAGDTLEIIADDEIRQLAHIGDPIGFYFKDKKTMAGNIKDIDGNSIRVLIPA